MAQSGKEQLGLTVTQEHPSLADSKYNMDLLHTQVTTRDVTRHKERGNYS